MLIIFSFISALRTDNSYGMVIAAPDETVENLITNTSGLTPQEETLLIDAIKGIVSTTKRSWYPEQFSPSEDNSYSATSDGERVAKLQSLTDMSMQVIKMIDKRLKEIETEKRIKMGSFAFLHDMDSTPYRISTNSPYIVFEIQKYNCLKNKGVFLPSNLSRDVSGSLWLEYTDSVYIPFNCPIEPDYDRVKAAMDHQNLMAQHGRTARAVPGNSGNGTITIVQVNLTLTSETFEKTLYNQNSNNYIDLTRRLTHEIETIFSVTGKYNGVNDFSYRPGSVIATFHIETNDASPVSFVKTKLLNATNNEKLGNFAVNSNLLKVGEFTPENAHYYPWGEWGTCSKTCGTGSRSRSRSCNSTVPLACAHEGPIVETEECYEQYCSQGCREMFTGDRGNFSSPVVDGKYPNGADCVWQISVDENHTVVVLFNKFNLELDKKCKYDFVAFYDGSYASPDAHSDRELLRFCGNSTPPHSYPRTGYPINSSSNAITVRFKTDDDIARIGFSAIWYKELKYHLRVSNIKPQHVTALSFIYNPWSMMKSAAIPLGKASTCPESRGDDSCYFPGKHTVISRVISVFLNREMDIKPSNPVILKFEHILDETIFPQAYTGRKTCVTWDHSMKSPASGSWTKRGCSTSFSNLTHTTCKCAHTGMFAVLGLMKPPPKDLHIKANTYLGSAIFVILIIATIHSLATKEKKTTGELFHIFEAIISGALLITFLTGAHVPAEKDLCGFLTFFLYYLVLSQFTWMLLTVFWMQNFLKRILNEKVRIKIVYFVLGWGVPVILAGVAGKIDIDKNGHEDNVCWVSVTGVGTVWGFGAPVFAMFVVNIIIFVYLLLPIAKDKFHQEKLRPRIVKEFFVMLSFIITGCLGAKMILNDRFSNQYFFCLFLVLQGALNYNVCHESTELFWKKQEEATENEAQKEEPNEEDTQEKAEEIESKDNENQQTRMTVKTLKNLNIYKENGVFVIEA